MLAAGRMVSFLGPGGVGKSRMVLQMAICCILGEKFLGIDSHARGKKWLIIQTENNNRRLSSDLRAFARAYNLTDSRLALIKRCLAIENSMKKQIRVKLKKGGFIARGCGAVRPDKRKVTTIS